MSFGQLFRAGIVVPTLGVAAASAQPIPASAAVDIQFSLCAAPSVIEKRLSLHQQGGSIKVWLFDDKSLNLFSRGLRLRLRETKSGGELTLKVANQDCAALPKGQLPSGAGKCEYDMHGDKTTGALSLTRSVSKSKMQSLLASHQQLAEQLSETQKQFLQGPAGIWPLPTGVHAMGPTSVRSYRTTGKNYSVDVSTLPSGDDYIEISQKVAQSNAPRTRDELLAELQKSGVALCADQSAQAGNKLRKLAGQP